MALEVFANTLGNAYLQRHLLAVGPRDLDEAIRAGNEFLQIRPVGTNTSPKVRVVEDDYEEEEDYRLEGSPLGEEEYSYPDQVQVMGDAEGVS